jgi:MFS family permease
VSDEQQGHDDGGSTPPPPPPPPPPPSAGPPDDSSAPPRRRGQAVGDSARATARGLAAAGRATGKAGRSTLHRARRAAGAQGADKSGLNRLIELHACNAAGDTAVAIALAGTIFFSGATSEQRTQVALFLGLTMLPFAVVAPLIGPFLDRFSHGRRWAIGSTFAIRAFLCWVLAGAVAAESEWMYPAALGVLVSSKAYGVTRAAAVPRLQPEDMTLVKTNGRVSLAGVVGATLSAPIAGAAAYFGSDWALRYAFFVFVLGTIAAILLPAKVDSQAGEEPQPQVGRKRRRALNPPRVAFALRANCGPRWLSGFLTMYLAFLLRDNPIDGWEERGTLLLGVVVAAAGLGNTLGIVTASLARRMQPGVIVVAMLLLDIVVVTASAVLYGLVTVVVLGLTAGIAQYLAKVSLDSTIQSDIPHRNHASAFARGDTTLQLAWVVGGFCGIAMPLVPQVGLGVAAVVLAGWSVLVLRDRPKSPEQERAGTSAAATPT